MQTRRFADRTVAHKWAARERPTTADRVVMACEQCPATRPSKRRPPRWALVARNLAARFSIDANALRTALVSEAVVTVDALDDAGDLAGVSRS